MPKYGPEETNVGAVVDRQVQLESAVDNLRVSVDQLSSTQSCPPVHDASMIASMQEMLQKLDSLSTTISTQLHQLNDTCQQLSARDQLGTRPVSERHRQHDGERDRHANVVVFGVEENRDVSVWRQKVLDALTYVHGRGIDINDMFRIGKFVAGKIRPIVVKLRSVWDRRLILSSCYKLKNYHERVFVVPDEPLEVRRKRMFDRLRKRAEHDGRQVTVLNDVLTVDGTDVFSLQHGYIAQNRNG